jgi:hypothetical protein
VAGCFLREQVCAKLVSLRQLQMSLPTFATVPGERKSSFFPRPTTKVDRIIFRAPLEQPFVTSFDLALRCHCGTLFTD